MGEFFIPPSRVQQEYNSLLVNALMNHIFTALFRNMRIVKFKRQLTIAFFAAVNHLNGPPRKQNFTLTGSKGHSLWFVIGGFGSVVSRTDCFYCAFHKHANSKVQRPPSQLRFSLLSIIITISSNEPWNDGSKSTNHKSQTMTFWTR